jgi:thiol:disulfide interchange protein DsbD
MVKTITDANFNSVLEENEITVLDFWADWCTACIDMEEHVFNQHSVQQTLGSYTLLQIDLTNNSTDHQKGKWTRPLLFHWGKVG